MRRGHPNVGGWRSENQRHFRPRNVGLPHFRLPRPFGPPEGLRFRSPHPRPYRAIRSFGHARGHADEQLEQHRNQYRINNLERRQNQEKESYKHNRHDLPTFSHQSQRDNDQGAKHNSRFFQSPSTSQQVHVNSMGDTDFRYHPKENNDEFSSHKKSPWRHSAPQHNYNQQYEDHKQYEDYKNACKTPKRYNHVDEMPLPDYSGHRPPASDHYTATSSANNNNSQYTHSVDDTVDIVRKRLMNRNRQPSPESLRQQSNVDEDLRTERVEHYQTPPREQPVRRKVQRPKQNIKSNCNNMKNKIVQQLFKMDKTKIHKLMDNPSSSSKFEYAISTLITEGQNSLNRHMRSMAEKSLYNSSSDFIQSDSNSFYEDVFMKQMQGILDPKDTELLGDIKPVVLAELSRVLQIDDYDEGIADQSHYMQNVEPDDYHESMPHQSRRYTQKIETDDYSYFNEDYNTEQHGQDTFYSDQFEGYENYDQINSSEQHSTFESKPLYERRKNKKKDPCNERQSPENRCSSQSTDASFDSQQGMQIKRSPCDEQIPLFNPNLDQLSDEDDPFAELDQQYHVEVDHNFIDSTSRAPSPQQSFVEYKNELPRVSKSPKQSRNIETPIDIQSDAQLLKESSIEIKKEIDSQIQSMANVTVALLPLKSTLNEAESLSPLKKECEEGMDSELNLEKENNTTIESVSEEHVIKKDNIKIEPKFDIDNTKSKIQRNSRKRSTDQKPSHRKEKRKKRAEADCEEIAQSIVNMFYTNDDQKKTSKDSKKVVPTEKTYSNKYVKRKDKNEKQCSSSPKSDESKKHISNSSSHSSVTPKIIANQESSSKSEAKVKLKSIDMFVEQPKKAAAHVARRNTATSVPIDKSPEDSRPKISTIPPPVVSFARKLTRRHIGTQVLLKLHNKHCQSDKTEIFCKETQTDPISISPPKPNLSNPLERMKEIDMEIQVLLQEKFKLYHSIETKTDSVDTVPSISMKIFDMTEPIESNTIDLTEDAIVEDFTNIPTEELEEIAMETFADTIIPIKSDKKAKRQKVVQESPVTPKTPKSRNTRKTKNVKTPNISLIEQIITDDRPIEDIISLDDLETTPVKSKKKCKAVPKKKASKKSKLSKVLQSQPTMKSCCVVVERIDISHYLNSAKKVDNNNLLKLELPVVDNKSLPESSNTPEVSYEEMSDINVTAQVIEDVVNDLQFDMLDVSEDIIIGDICEVKTDKADGKPISEDIILDNSQSSMEEAVAEASTADECKMYDYSTNDNLRREAITVSGHADAVLAIECIENDFIVACLDGNVYHFSGNGQLINTLRGSNLAVTCLTIVRDKYETTVYTGSLDSRIRYYDLETGMEKGPECNVLSPIQTMDRAWDTVFVGTRTGYVLQFECKNNMLIPISTVKFSEQSILALRALKEGPRKVLLVAARSENVTIKDAQTGLLLRTLSGPKMTVYTLLFEDGKVYCGTSSHNIHVFDYTNGSHVWSHAGGKGAVCLRARGGLVFAGCYDGCVYVFREGEARPLAHIRGPSLMLLSLAVRGSSIIAGYKDRGLYIWKMPLAIIQEMVL